MESLILELLLFVLVSVKACYWNAEHPYMYYSSKTPYNTIRGDIRDYVVPKNCQAISVWTMNRHGNRSPGRSVIKKLKVIAGLKHEIIASYDAGRSQMCAQDIEEFRKWSWDETLETSLSALTETGYKEVYGIGKRLREAYPYLLQGSEEDFHIRPTTEYRIKTSAFAFVDGLTEGTNMSLAVADGRSQDDVVGPYMTCERYTKQVKVVEKLKELTDAYAETLDYVTVQNAVQQRLGIATQLSAEDIYSFYEFCRFERSWSPTLQSPWCSVFTDFDLMVLEYRDDLCYHYRNGYGSSINVKLGGPAIKDLYENFQASVQVKGKKIVSYFAHNAMMEMVYSALGLFKDDSLEVTRRDPNRLWKTSFLAAFSVNVIAVLYRCVESGTQSYRVQIFVNEKVSAICPLEGCTWEEFQEKFKKFTTANLDICSMDYREPESAPKVESASVTVKGVLICVNIISMQLILIGFWIFYKKRQHARSVICYLANPFRMSLKKFIKSKKCNSNTPKNSWRRSGEV